MEQPERKTAGTLQSWKKNTSVQTLGLIKKYKIDLNFKDKSVKERVFLKRNGSTFVETIRLCPTVLKKEYAYKHLLVD